MPYSEDFFIGTDALLHDEDAVDALLEGRSSQTPAGYEHVAKLLNTVASVEADQRDCDNSGEYMDFVEKLAMAISQNRPTPVRAQLIKRVATRRTASISAVTLAGFAGILGLSTGPVPLASLAASSSSGITTTTRLPEVLIQNAAADVTREGRNEVEAIVSPVVDDVPRESPETTLAPIEDPTVPAVEVRTTPAPQVRSAVKQEASEPISTTTTTEPFDVVAVATTLPAERAKKAPNTRDPQSAQRKAKEERQAAKKAAKQQAEKQRKSADKKRAEGKKKGDGKMNKK